MAARAGARQRSAALALLVTLIGAGCGTTQIVASDPRAHILVDGRSIGRGRGEIDKRGTPGGVTVVVKTDDGRREEQTIRRSFTGLTLLFGLFTYGVCLIACWEYPDMVFVQMPEPAHGAPGQQGSWGGPPAGADPWMQPPPGWQKPAAAAPPSAP